MLTRTKRETVLRDTREAGRPAYDRIADGYDDRWTPHVREPQARLTRDLRIRAGDRVLDLGCGTGVDTLEMLELAAPGEVVAVDSSPAMLKAAVSRAQARSLPLTPICAPAERVAHQMPPASFDVVSIRFCLAYLPWRETLPILAGVLRTDGRLGVLTNLACSTPQALSIYRQMARELEIEPIEPPVPQSMRELSEVLTGGGLSPMEQWHHRFRIWFASGLEAIAWMRDSGYIAHPELERVDEAVLESLMTTFGQRLEARFREDQGVPLDFELVGVVAKKP